MSEERLQEIKDSVEFQYTLAKAKGFDNALLFTNEEEELIEEIERLNNIINNLINYIGQEWYCFDNESVEFYVAKDILNKLQELKGEDKE